jgi:hypothetical protein
VCFYETSRDRQPQARSAAAACTVGSPEAFEHPGRSVVRQSFAAVFDSEDEVSSALLDPDGNRAV